MTITDNIYGLNSAVAIKAPVKVVATSNITLNGEQTISSIPCVSGDRVLCIAQDITTENGIYTVDTGAWKRSSDFDGVGDVVQGTLVPVYNDAPSSLMYRLTTAAPVSIGSDDINFEAVGLTGLDNVATVLSSLADKDLLYYDATSSKWKNKTLASLKADLDLEIGVDVQAYDVELDALASVTSAANKVPMFSGSETATVIDFLDEDDMASDSDEAVASQQSIKAYVDSKAIVQQVSTSDNTANSAVVYFPYDDTIPQNTEGMEVITLAITPTNTSNTLVIEGVVNVSSTASNEIIIAALFKDSDADAIQVATGHVSIANSLITIPISYRMVAGTTSEITFKIRAGGEDSGSTTYINSDSGGRKFGGRMYNSLTIKEIV